MGVIIEFLASILILLGAAFGLLGSLGLVRLPDFFARLHAPTKAATLGIGALLIAAIILPLSAGRLPGMPELLLTLLIFITAPVSANMLSLAAFRIAGSKPSVSSGKSDADPSDDSRL